jgi:hypothetical protein
MNRVSILVALMGGVALLAAAGDARADPRDGAFRYTTRSDPEPLRALAEEAVILGIGYAQYTSNATNEEDWDLDAGWTTIKKKVLLEAVSFDNNRFDTNWMTHPFAGYFYYAAARENRLSIAQSFTYAFASSTFWEYVGEVREHAAINDIVVTPVTGLALGENLVQLGALMHRSKRTPLSLGLGWLFAPLKSSHDALDELAPDRSGPHDDLGLPADVWHRFRFGVAGGATQQDGSRAQGDARFAIESRIVTLSGYRDAGGGSRWFDSGEVSALGLRGAVSSNGSLVDFLFEASVLPFGFYAKEVARTADGELSGHSFLLGLPVVVEYGQHDYDRDRKRGEDRIALVGTGASVEESAFAGPLAVHARVDGLVSLAGVDSYGLDDYRVRFGETRINSVTSRWGYYHAVGATIHPAIEITCGRLDAGASARFDWFDAITEGDVDPIPGGAAYRANDRRRIDRAWIGISPVRHLRLSVTAERRERDGRVGPAPRASRAEVGLFAGAEVVF